MNTQHMCTRLSTVVLVVALLMLAAAGGAHAAEPPVKETLTSTIGWEVDQTTKGKICTVASGHKCQPALPSSQPGGFEYTEGIAVNNSTGNVYVVDKSNVRVQQLTESGDFVRQFGGKGTAVGQFGAPKNAALDQATGDLYVSDNESGAGNTVAYRVQKFTPEGKFVLEIGKEVNETKTGAVKAKGGTPTVTELEEENLCTQEEIETKAIKCKGAALTTNGAEETSEPGAFMTEIKGMAVGPGSVLYVATDGRVQEFSPNGKYLKEISLPVEDPGMVPFEPRAIAVDAAGTIYLIKGPTSSPDISRLDDKGEPLPSLEVVRQAANSKIFLFSLAVDVSGRLAVAGVEIGETEIGGKVRHFGLLLDSDTGRQITEFTVPNTDEVAGLAFGPNDGLYGTVEHEVVAYTAFPVAELVGDAGGCSESGESDSSVKFGCTLPGEVNPEGVPNTEVWFEWGTTPALGQETPRQPVAEGTSPVPVHAEVDGIAPNRTVYYRLRGFDQNVQPPETPLTSEIAAASSGTVAPRVVGAPAASFVRSASAVVFGELNPENSGTEYEFQYAPAESCTSLEAGCAVVVQTGAAVSSTYGKIGASAEISGLQPGTAYRYRLFARNEKGEPVKGEKGETALPEGMFTTIAAPAPVAVTGATEGVGVTSATITGAVDPDGEPAVYTFQLGIANGADTQYGVVSSGTVENSGALVAEQAVLSGLQPGTKYAYRITAKSGNIHDPTNEVLGQMEEFATPGLPEVLPVGGPVPMLSVPHTSFPKAVKPSKKKKKTKRKIKKRKPTRKSAAHKH